MGSSIQLHTASDILTVARTLLASGLLPRDINTEQKVFAIITMGQDLGLTMWQSLNGINVIKGKPSLSVMTMTALVQKSGLLEDMTFTSSADSASVTMKRKGRSANTYTFTMKDAQLMGLSANDNYKKQPATMLLNRALGKGYRIDFADVIGGFYPAEELDPDGVIISDDGGLVIVERPADPAPVEQAAATDGEHRTVTVTAVRRVAIKSSTPIWGMICHDDTGAEYKSSIASRKELGDAKDIGAAWDTTIGNVTEVNFKATLEYEAESGYWWFAGVAS